MRMVGRMLALAGSIIFIASLGFAAPAAAQATRTWVSGVGDDANPCSRTAPCKTFAGAISKTAAGGEINCLDDGGFGAVTITKAMTIDCVTHEGGISASGTTGVLVNAGVNDVVTLRGLDILGGGTAVNGVRFIAGGALQIEDSVIRGVNAANAYGVNFAPSGASRLLILNSVISNNGNATGATGGGVLIQPTGAGGSAQVVIRNTTINGNLGAGLVASTVGNTGGPNTLVAIIGGSVSGNNAGVSAVSPPATKSVGVSLTGVVVTQNATFGVGSNGSTAQIRMMDTLLSGNNEGIKIASGGFVLSYGNNVRFGNATEGAFSATLPQS